MNKFFLTVISAVALGGLLKVDAQDGFVIWSKGNQCDRELMYTELIDMKPTETKVAVAKGVGADIWPVISYDGQWIAWSRNEELFSEKYGKCDYHGFQYWKLYIAKIDGGKIIPATPIKVTDGYLPQWGDDAPDPNQGKALYYTNYSTQEIMKIFIKPDGAFSEPKVQGTCSVKKEGRGAHTQGSPNGRYIAFRPGQGIEVLDNTTNKLIPGSGGAGCHPHWGPRSKYLLWAHTSVCKIEDGKVTMGKKNAGLGDYYEGFSNDAYYDEGKVWVIGRIGGGGQNDAGDVQFKEVDISDGGYKVVGKGVSVGKGTAADIHVWGPEGPTSMYPNTNQMPGNGINFSTLVTKSASGLQLIIKSEELSSGYNAVLYNLQGKQNVFMNMSGSVKNVLPLKNVADGRYVLKLSSNKLSVLKSIFISR